MIRYKIFITLSLITAVFAASHGTTASARSRLSIPRELQNRDILPEIITLNDSPREEDLVCPDIMSKDFTFWRPRAIQEKVAVMNFSPQCLWKTILKNAKKRKDRVLGFAFGAVAEAGFYLSGSTGTEMVIMQYDAQTLMVGQVDYKEISLDVGLPAGASVTQSVIFGTCNQSIFGYLGPFNSFYAIAMTRSYGQREFIDSNGIQDTEFTGCDSITSTRGFTSSIVGVGSSYYTQAGSFALVRGERVKPLLNYLSQLNQNK